MAPSTFHRRIAQEDTTAVEAARRAGGDAAAAAESKRQGENLEKGAEIATRVVGSASRFVLGPSITELLSNLFFDRKN